MTNIASGQVKDDSGYDPHGAVSHVMGAPTLLAVFAVLIALTAATVCATWVDLGPFNLVLALGIATIKAVLVALIFMHLLYDHPFHGFVFVTSLVFLAIFLTFALVDTTQYQPDVRSYMQQQVKKP